MARWLIGLLAVSGCSWVLHLDTFEHDGGVTPMSDAGDAHGLFDDAPASKIELLQGVPAFGNGTVVTASLTKLVRQGDLLVVIVEWSSGELPMVGDSDGNNFLEAGNIAGGVAQLQAMFYAPNAQSVGAFDTVTVSFGAATSSRVRVYELTGIATGTVASANTGAAASGTMISGADVAVSQPDSLVIAGYVTGGNVIPGPQMMVAGMPDTVTIDEYVIAETPATYYAPVLVSPAGSYIENIAVFKGGM